MPCRAAPSVLAPWGRAVPNAVRKGAHGALAPERPGRHVRLLCGLWGCGPGTGVASDGQPVDRERPPYGVFRGRDDAAACTNRQRGELPHGVGDGARGGVGAVLGEQAKQVQHADSGEGA